MNSRHDKKPEIIAKEVKFALEVCVDCIESAVKAANGGAHRLELCQALSVGGLTPSLGFFQEVRKKINIPVFVLIRPRPGNFVFSQDDTDVMVADIEKFVQHGADGIVIGALKKDCCIDEDVCRRLLCAAEGLPVTFNRAFDLTPDLAQSLITVINLGCTRVITSGGTEDCFIGIEMIHKLISLALDKIIVIPAGGITTENLRKILCVTKAKEFHASASSMTDVIYKSPNDKVMQALSAGFYRVCSEKTVSTMIAIAKKHFEKE